MLTRRFFLKSGGIALFTLGVGGGPGFLARAALAAPGSGSTPSRRRKVLVTIFQRGAMDGLAAVPPIDGALLKTLRPRLAMSGARAEGDRALLDLGTGFGLHPAFEPLLPLWKEKRLGIVHAVGSPDPTRSHFDAQDFMETGTPGRKGTPNGWLNRAVGLLGHEGSPFRAVAMTPSLPRSLYGDEPAIAVTNLADFKVQLPGADRTRRRRGARLRGALRADLPGAAAGHRRRDLPGGPHALGGRDPALQAGGRGRLSQDAARQRPAADRPPRSSPTSGWRSPSPSPPAGTPTSSRPRPSAGRRWISRGRSRPSGPISAPIRTGSC